MGKNYWMMVASPEDFEITKQHGFTVYGVRGKYRRRAQRMQPEDRILFYVTGLRKWTATATITSQFFEDRTPIWNVDGRTEVYPFRVKTKPEIVLGEADYIDALLLAPRLDYVKRWAPEDWPLAFFESLHLLPQKDFRLIEAEMNRFVAPKRNGRRRQQPANSSNNGQALNQRTQGWDQDRRRTSSSNNDWRNGPPVQTPPKDPSETPVAESIDKHAPVARSTPEWKAPTPATVDEQVRTSAEIAPSQPADEHRDEQTAAQQEPESPQNMSDNEQPFDNGEPEAGATDVARDSVVDDHPATDDSSTESSSTT